MQGGGAQPSNDIGQKIRDWFNQIPAFSLGMMYTILVVFLIVQFTTVAVHLVNFPSLVVFKGEVWRLATATFIIPGVLNLLISLLFYMMTACEMERRMGSVKYAVYFIVNSRRYIGLLVQLLYMALALSLPFTGIEMFATTGPYYGLWGIIMLEIVVRYNRDPELAISYLSYRLWCCPATIKAKYYPWLLLLLFTFFNMTFLDVWSGFAIGYIRIHYLDVHEGLQCSLLSDTTASRLEASCFCGWLKSVRGFVSAENSGLPFTVVQRVQGPTSSETGAQPQFIPFSGRGFTLAESGSGQPASRLQPNRYQPQNDDEEL